MSRSVQWRRKQPEVVAGRAEEALQKTLYIVHQTGPTGFVVKEDGWEKTFKIYLGDIHQCSCSVYRKQKELCIHILWILLKKFRVPNDSPLTYQLGLVEREINEILHGNQTQQVPQEATPTNQTDQSKCVVRRAITPEDVCPICQDHFSTRPVAITYCKFGCGQNVHVKCMRIWGEHQKSSDAAVHCPICRAEFPSLKELCSGDMYTYQPTSPVDHTQRRGYRQHDRIHRLISRLRAYPIPRDSMLLGQGVRCEMCGEGYQLGEWLRRLPCNHKFHRDCIDHWLTAGHTSCPVDGMSVCKHKSERKKLPVREERGRERLGRRDTGEDLTLSGHSIVLPLLPKVSPSTTKSFGELNSRSKQPAKSRDFLHQSHDVSHDSTPSLKLPPLFPPNPSPHKTTPTSKRQPSSLRRGLPTLRTLPPHGKRTHSISVDNTNLLVSSLKLCPSSH